MGLWTGTQGGLIGLEKEHSQPRRLVAYRKRVYRPFRGGGPPLPRRSRLNCCRSVASNGIDHQLATYGDDVWCRNFVLGMVFLDWPMPVRIPADEYMRWRLLLLVERSMKGPRIRLQITNVFKVRYAEALQERQLLVVHRYAAEAVARGAKMGWLQIDSASRLQYGYVESFIRKLRCEFLKLEIFTYLHGAKPLAAYRWR